MVRFRNLCFFYNFVLLLNRIKFFILINIRMKNEKRKEKSIFFRYGRKYDLGVFFKEMEIMENIFIIICLLYNFS